MGLVLDAAIAGDEFWTAGEFFRTEMRVSV